MPTPSYFYARNKRKNGPVTLKELRRLVDSGDIRRSDMILEQGTRAWIEACDVPGLFTPPRREGHWLISRAGLAVFGSGLGLLALLLWVLLRSPEGADTKVMCRRTLRLPPPSQPPRPRRLP